MNLFWYDWAGYIGVVLVLLAFLLMQAHVLHGNRLVYQLMNVLGAFGVLLSLCFGPAPIQWPALLMQLAWIVIGVFGVVHSQRRRRDRSVYAQPTRPSGSHLS